MSTDLSGKIGQIITNADGEKMIIIDDQDDRLTVMFTDGTILSDQSWSAFRQRAIRKPNSSSNLYRMIGKSVTIRDEIQNRTCVCIDVRGDRLVVRFTDNGEVVDGVMPYEFIEGMVRTEEETPFKASKSRSLEMERMQTIRHATMILKQYHRCAIIRPCGFGKTYMAMDIMKSPQYRRCLYLSPATDKSDHIHETKEELRRHGKMIQIQTYHWLRGLSDKKLKDADYDLVVFDECHNIGGDADGTGAYMTFMAVNKLMLFHPNTHFLGLTATHVRMDGIDVIGSIFLNHITYPYGIDDAIRDGYMKPPRYYYCEYGVRERIRKKVENAERFVLLPGTQEHLINRDQFEEIFDTEDVQRIDAEHMPKNIREACSTLKDNSYMRFLVFYLTIDMINENKDTVTGWFRDAYPDYKIRTWEYHSRSPLTKAELDALERCPKTIDLIFSCSKLKEEYHGKNDTGIVMDRRTQSYSLYVQMLGRIMQCGSDKETIVFDIADNLHSDFVIQPLNVTIEEETREIIGQNEYKTRIPKTFAEAKKMFHGAINWDTVAREEKKTKKESGEKDKAGSKSGGNAAGEKGEAAAIAVREEPVQEQYEEAGQNEVRLFEKLAEKAQHQSIEQSLADYMRVTRQISGVEPIGTDSRGDLEEEMQPPHSEEMTARPAYGGDIGSGQEARRGEPAEQVPRSGAASIKQEVAAKEWADRPETAGGRIDRPEPVITPAEALHSQSIGHAAPVKNEGATATPQAAAGYAETAEKADAANSGKPAPATGGNSGSPDFVEKLAEEARVLEASYAPARKNDTGIDSIPQAIVGSEESASAAGVKANDLETDILKTIEERKNMAENTGFDAAPYVYHKQRFFNKNVSSRFQAASVDDIISEIFVSQTKELLDKVMAIYNKHAQKYDTYEDYRKDKNARKYMKASAGLYNIKPNVAEEYMITGNVPRWT